MSQIPGRLPLITLLMVLALLLSIRSMPDRSMVFLRNLGAVWDLALFCAVPLVLGWFVYWVYLRKILRARRIAAIRMRRLVEEAAERDVRGSDR